MKIFPICAVLGFLWIHISTYLTKNKKNLLKIKALNDYDLNIEERNVKFRRNIFLVIFLSVPFVFGFIFFKFSDTLGEYIAGLTILILCGCIASVYYYNKVLSTIISEKEKRSL